MTSLGWKLMALVGGALGVTGIVYLALREPSDGGVELDVTGSPLTSTDVATEIARDFVKGEEGFRAQAYEDPKGSGKWSVGYGAQGSDVGPSTVWTQAQADADLAHRIGVIVGQVRSAVNADLPPQSVAALASFAYNLGIQSLRSSMLLRLLNAGDYNGAAAQFAVWRNSRDRNGNLVVNQTLVGRRARERDLFLAGLQSGSLVS
jgi:lysozyme